MCAQNAKSEPVILWLFISWRKTMPNLLLSAAKFDFTIKFNLKIIYKYKTVPMAGTIVYFIFPNFANELTITILNHGHQHL